MNEIVKNIEYVEYRRDSLREQHLEETIIELEILLRQSTVLDMHALIMHSFTIELFSAFHFHDHHVD